MSHGCKGIAKPIAQWHQRVTDPDKRASAAIWLCDIGHERQQHERIAWAGAAARQLIQQVRKVACADGSAREGLVKHIVNQAQEGGAVNPFCTADLYFVARDTLPAGKVSQAKV